tara:strand:- start:730 stop:1275 length:546 start_codon:yes stop_codon:yes gene_type:complete
MSLIADDKVIDQDIVQLLNQQIDLLQDIKLSNETVRQVRLMGNDGRYISSNEAGELLISDGPYDLAKFNELSTIDTAYNFFLPNGRKQFVMTGFLMYGDKQVASATNATVIIYEASQVDSTTTDRILIQVEVGQNQSIPFPNIRILCNVGVYINAKTDDDDIHMTIFGHYVDLMGRGETNG